MRWKRSWPEKRRQLVMLKAELSDQGKSLLEFLESIYICNKYLGAKHSSTSYTEKDRNTQKEELTAFTNRMELICNRVKCP